MGFDLSAKAGSAGKIHQILVDLQSLTAATTFVSVWNKNCPGKVELLDAVLWLRTAGPTTTGDLLIQRGDGAASETFNTICTLVTEAAAAGAVVRATAIDATYNQISAAGSIKVVPDATVNDNSINGLLILTVRELD